MSKQSAGPLNTQLRDGTRLIARPVEPGDRARLAAGFEGLSDRSRHERFHASIKRLSEEQLTYFTNVDHVDHEAWVLLDADYPETPGVGIARYVRDNDDPTVAEAAITIADAYQGQGAGTLLMGILAKQARKQGIRTFRNYVLPDNTEMLDLLDSLGCSIRRKPNEEVMEVDLPLQPMDEKQARSPLQRALAAIASKRDALTWLIPPA